jgi:hypothetical protein
MIEPAVFVVKPEEKRSDELSLGPIAKSADNTVRGAQAFDFQHDAFAGAIRLLQRLGDNAVERAVAGASQPGLRLCGLAADRRQA